jgi:hypothetical protein
MIGEQKRLVCTNHECGAEFIVLRKPAVEKQNLRCACGSELKKYYHAPEFRISEGNIFRDDKTFGQVSR